MSKLKILYREFKVGDSKYRNESFSVDYLIQKGWEKVGSKTWCEYWRNPKGEIIEFLVEDYENNC